MDEILTLVVKSFVFLRWHRTITPGASSLVSALRLELEVTPQTGYHLLAF